MIRKNFEAMLEKMFPKGPPPREHAVYRQLWLAYIWGIGFTLDNDARKLEIVSELDAYLNRAAVETGKGVTH